MSHVSWIFKGLSDYSMVYVLLTLLLIMSLATLGKQQTEGSSAGRELAEKIGAMSGSRNVLIVAPDSNLDSEMTRSLVANLRGTEHRVLSVVNGNTIDARAALDKIRDSGETLHVIACTETVARWDVIQDIAVDYSDTPVIAGGQVIYPESWWWPDVLMPDNLVAILSRISVIAIIAIGMTMVIITAGIDLSVGSLIALSAVVTGVLVRDMAGGQEAGLGGVALCVIFGILAAGFAGFVSGTFIAGFRIPPFIMTLAMMQSVRGLAFAVVDRKTVYEMPESFRELGAERLMGLPYAVVLMVFLYVIAHIIMSRTTLGRQIYAVGGNEEAARLSGVPVKRTLVIVYTVCGLLAGLGGVINVTQLGVAGGDFGAMKELDVIAAVVVGGTSLRGGQGKIMGTLIGAAIIGVILNGMNQIGLNSDLQLIVLGAVILGAVLVDCIRPSFLGRSTD